ncbi:hypothetical protein MPSEU_000533700 [Mayamaea pseudoterrestris]|nr:hypothetical protein MPSEU_000533700 [Mayamaea pseudoterrestris]
MMLASRTLRLRVSQQSRLWQRSLAAATSKQKRALNPEQIHGTPTASTNTTTKSPPPPPPTSVKPPASIGNSSASNNLIPFGIVGAVAVGGGAFYFAKQMSGDETSVTPNAKSTMVAKESVVDTPAKAEPATLSGSLKNLQSTNASEGNRVTSIAMPPKMKNANASYTPPLPANPIDGHRVSSLTPITTKNNDEGEVKGKEKEKEKEEARKTILADASMTKQAIQELTPKESSPASLESQESLIKSHHSLWSSMEESYLKDLDTLTYSQLQTRIVQLASELKERTKWEAVRLKEFLAMKERETANHYMDLMQKQRSEFESILAERLRNLEHELQLKANAALQEKEMTIQNLLSTALEAQKKEHEEDMKAQEELIRLQITTQVQDEFSQQLELYKKQVAQELEQKVSALQSLTKKLQKLENALQASQTFQNSSMYAHRLSAAALALAERLESHQPVAAEITALQSVAGEEGVIPTALQTIPSSAAQTGVPTLAELQADFDLVYDKCRQAALVPKGRTGVVGQLAGMLFAKLKYPPSPDEPAPEGTSNQPADNAEYLLARAKKHVSFGQLEQAVDQLEHLTGQAGFTAKDWKQQAMDRIAVDKALRVIKMECALLNESMSE